MDINNLTIKDFIDKNEDVWAEMVKLPIPELKKLISKWEDKAIDDSIQDIINEKQNQMVIEKLDQAFPTPEDKELFGEVLLQDRDITWSFIKRYMWR